MTCSLVCLAQSAILLADTPIVSHIKRLPVVSSNVASVGYSRRLHALEIEFTRGATYRYLDVSREVYEQLLATDSKGGFVDKYIRGKYRFVRVRSSRKAK